MHSPLLVRLAQLCVGVGAMLAMVVVSVASVSGDLPGVATSTTQLEASRDTSNDAIPTTLILTFSEPLDVTVSETVRPGWGCGDKNHTHTGPPGRPGAPSPCK